MGRPELATDPRFADAASRWNHQPDDHMAPHAHTGARARRSGRPSLDVGGDEEWESLCRAMGRPELATDPRFADSASRKQMTPALWSRAFHPLERHQDDLDAIINEWTSQLEPREVFDMLQEAGVASGYIVACTSCDLCWTWRYWRTRRWSTGSLYQSLDHEEVGTLQYHGPGWLMSKTPNRLR